MGWSVNYRFPSADEIEQEPSFMGDLLAYMDSPEGELFIEIDDIVSSVIEKADVDAKQRQIIWEDGKRLSITASAQRIAVEHPDYPLDIIEQNVIIRLESEFVPPTSTPDQLDELDRLPRRGFGIKNGKPREPRRGQELGTLELAEQSLVNPQVGMCGLIVNVR